MHRRTFLLGGAAAGGVVLLGAGGGIFAHGVNARPAAAATPLTEQEQASMIAGLRPPKRKRPVIAILADAPGTETTDLLIPFGVLSRAQLADVFVAAETDAPIALMPALRIDPQITFAELTRRYPGGPDYVIVPALHHAKQASAIQWIKQCAEGGATIIGVCEGAMTVAAAGLLDGRRGTTHWFKVAKLLREHPSMQWVPDRRYVVDRGVVTTTGVTASLPISIALVEAIGGRTTAESVARDLGVPRWDAQHRSADFRLNGSWFSTALANWAELWGHERLGVNISDDVDEVALSAIADPYSRTYRSRVLTISADQQTVKTRFGLRLYADLQGPQGVSDTIAIPSLPAAQTFDVALDGIARRYGERTAVFVALQLEYPWRQVDKPIA